jgi:signal transduction histidine kinase
MRSPDVDARHAMRRLHHVATALAREVTAETVSEVVLDEGTALLGAARAGLWTTSPEGLVLAGSRNYPDEAKVMYRLLRPDGVTPMDESARTRAMQWVESRADFAKRFPAAAAASLTTGDVSFVCLPLTVGDQLLGVVAFSFDAARTFTDDERLFAEMVAQHAADALERSRLFLAEQDARRRAEEKRRRAEFLGRASAELAKSLESSETLRAVAALAVPTIADWCAIEMKGENGAPSYQVAVAHVDPAKVALALELRVRYPADPDEPAGVQHVLRTGEPELYPDISDELLAAATRDAQHLHLARELGLRSAMVVPIRAEGETIGAITFVAAESARRYQPLDLTMAQDLADRAGLAITNARLFEAERTAVRLRDEFLAIAGHELKTPLTALRLQLDTLKKLAGAGVTERVVERSEKARHLLDRLVRLVEELLDVSRITSGRLQLDLEPVDLGALVYEVLGRFQDHTRRSEVRIAIRDAISGTWDRLRIDQIVTNLVANAIKYGEDKPIDVTVERRDSHAVLTVQDRGIGISEEDQRRIFERFERAVSERHFGGFGLGLWIVRQIVEAHGGTVSVESAPGHGSTFRVEIPLAQKP